MHARHHRFRVDREERIEKGPRGDDAESTRSKANPEKKGAWSDGRALAPGSPATHSLRRTPVCAPVRWSARAPRTSPDGVSPLTATSSTAFSCCYCCRRCSCSSPTPLAPAPPRTFYPFLLAFAFDKLSPLSAPVLAGTDTVFRTAQYSLFTDCRYDYLIVCCSGCFLLCFFGFRSCFRYPCLLVHACGGAPPSYRSFVRGGGVYISNQNAASSLALHSRSAGCRRRFSELSLRLMLQFIFISMVLRFWLF